MRVFQCRHRQPARDQCRNELDDERRLAGAAPAGKADDAHQCAFAAGAKPMRAIALCTPASWHASRKAITAGRSRRDFGMMKAKCSSVSGMKPRPYASATDEIATPQSARPCATAAATALCERG